MALRDYRFAFSGISELCRGFFAITRDDVGGGGVSIHKGVLQRDKCRDCPLSNDSIGGGHVVGAARASLAPKCSGVLSNLFDIGCHA